MDNWDVGRLTRNRLWVGLGGLSDTVRTSVRNYFTTSLMESVMNSVRNSVWDSIED